MSQQREFVPGQRWLSDSEPDLGLGLVTDVDFRTVSIDFKAVEETRRYARQQAPLTRLVLKPGDTVTVADLTLEILDLMQTPSGLIIYETQDEQGKRHPLPESLLPDTLSMNRPLDRLLSGQFEPCQWFYLKQQTLQLMGDAERSGLMGLCSARAELIPHQLYIANEVAGRYAPRVMLADEVGLGKTIEAGLILQQQLVSGLSTRILIVVPEPLLHQWLVEMLRRFNLSFTLLDQQRCEALQESGEDNPFTTAQLVLSPLSLFTRKPEWTQAAQSAGWDLCIVDEAHHVTLGELTTPDSRKLGEEITSAYQTLETLAGATKGLLLLTATPEQLGQENHFALLRLLDPARFTDFAAFVAEQANYQQIAARIKTMDNDDPQMRELLDQHGTGRILFRNTRRQLTGFPQRVLQPWPLAPGSEVTSSDPISPEPLGSEALGSEPDTSDPSDLFSDDPRVRWLADWLTGPGSKQREGKTLLICAHDALAIALEKHLRLKVGVRSSVFHRHMSLLERDRAAAYFAGEENAASILVCSEIGSEGRNFQFCRHLILFDLPINPDLLEQRIGRLDRIGQRHDVQIHVPYVIGSRQQRLFQWYHHGLNAFEHVAPGAFRLWQEFKSELDDWLGSEGLGSEANASDPNPSDPDFITRVKARNAALQLELEQGRDQLLERNSFNAQEADQLLKRIAAFEQHFTPEQWLLNVLDSYSVFYDRNSDGSISIVPGQDMLLPSFPGLPDEGFEACFKREQALRREDRAYLTWQHPTVTGAMDLVLNSHQGKASMSVFYPELAVSRSKSGASISTEAEWPAPGCAMIVECQYRMKVSAPAHLQLAKHLPATGFTFNMTLDHNNNVTALEHSLENQRQHLRFPDKAMALEALQTHQKLLLKLTNSADKMAVAACKQVADQVGKAMLTTQTLEIKRLLALKQRNPNIRQEELDYLKEQTLDLHQCLAQATPELMAIHVILSVQ
ncbi:RNA polymerase-associated protein RapA [Gammaproteobacteria bacterium LSUCC0112]|nr:RNA polymerase-associated protein RapA [Gammaproteobacteria bacterium LSUCC0112]